MSTKKQAQISVLSTITSADGAVGTEETRLTASGTVAVRDGIVLISYSEDGEGGRVECQLLIREDSVRLRRKGAVMLDAELQVGVAYSTVYSVPPYKFDMRITATEIERRIHAGGVTLSLTYDMSIGGDDRRVEMTVTANYS